MYFDPRIESKAHHICHCIGQNEKVELSDKSRHDIFFTVRAVADYWKGNLDKIREQNDTLKWNEIRLWAKRVQPDNIELQEAIQKLINKESIR